MPGIAALLATLSVPVLTGVVSVWLFGNTDPLEPF